MEREEGGEGGRKEEEWSRQKGNKEVRREGEKEVSLKHKDKSF